MSHPYTIKLADGKYTIINHGLKLEFLRNGQPYLACIPVNSSEVLAMAQRIEELEVAIMAVMAGSVIHGNLRNADGLLDFEESAWSVPLQKWKDTLRNVLEQK